MYLHKKSYSLKNTHISKIIYPEDIQCIIQSVNGVGGVYIGNFQAARNIRTLKQHNIKAVLTAAAQAKIRYEKKQIPYHLILPALDHELFPIEKFFEESYDFIDKHVGSTNILIHCMAGISRSVSLFIAYLIRKKKLSYEAAYAFVKSRRKIIYPNEGFVRQLKKFSEHHREKKETNPRSLSQNFFINPEEKTPSKNISQSPTKPLQTDRQYNFESPQQFSFHPPRQQPLYYGKYNYKSPYFQQQITKRYRKPLFKIQIDNEIQKIKKKYTLESNVKLFEKPFYNTDKKYRGDYLNSFRNYGLLGRDKIFSIYDEPYRSKYRNYY